MTLTTDFGLRDWFVGTMKGVILERAPQARIVDLTHGVPPGDLRAGALALMAGCRYFPRGTVHVAVVDPGVGSRRPALAVRTRDFCFVGPDNGVLSWALEREPAVEVRRIENPRLQLPPVGTTFHGRDVFAPVAAFLAAGGNFTQVGPRTAERVRLDWPPCKATRRGWKGEVIYVDHFGNLITNLAADLLAGREDASASVAVGRARAIPIGSCYAAVAAGRPVAVPGSTGFLEIAINRGHAARRLKADVGTPVVLRWQA